MNYGGPSSNVCHCRGLVTREVAVDKEDPGEIEFATPSGTLKKYNDYLGIYLR